MRQVVLPGRFRPVSALGLGTAALGRRLTRRQKRALLEEAFSLGISYFDTAPLYGRGTAEATIGAFAAGKRDEVALATKVGMRWHGRLRRQVERRFDAASARRSLEQSLRTLRTDRVDALLLHEPAPSDLTTEVVEFLLESVEAGRAGAVGVAAEGPVVTHVMERYGAAVRVLQTPLSDLPTLPPQDLFLVAHGAVAPVLRGRPVTDVARRADVDPASVPGLCLRRALDRNRDGIVLFGTGSRVHLREDVQALVAADPAALDRLDTALTRLDS